MQRAWGPCAHTNTRQLFHIKFAKTFLTTVAKSTTLNVAIILFCDKGITLLVIQFNVCLRVIDKATGSKKFFLPVWKWVKQGLTSGPFQPQHIAYDDLHTHPVPRCFYPISFGLRPVPNQALWPLTKTEAYDLLSLLDILRRTCFCGSNADLATSLWPLPSFFQSLPSLCGPVYSHVPLTWTIYSDFPFIASNYQQLLLISADLILMILCCGPDKQREKLLMPDNDLYIIRFTFLHISSFMSITCFILTSISCLT